MPYLNLDLNYFDHRKTRRLIGLLGRGAEVLPIRLWNYCGKFHCEDGRLSGYSEQEIEALASWWGKGGDMLPAMETCAWMHLGSDSVWFMHDWQEHQGHLAAFKIRAKAGAKARWDKARGEDAISIAASIAKPPDKQCPSQTIPTVLTKHPKPNPPDARAGNLEVELPRGFPVTVDDAIAHAAFVGCTVEFAIKVWNQAMSRNGHDAKGQAISSFRHHLAAQKAYEHDRRGPDKSTPDQRERTENLKLKRL